MQNKASTDDCQNSVVRIKALRRIANSSLSSTMPLQGHKSAQLRLLSL